MVENRCVTLFDRRIITVRSDDAKHFLQNLITTDLQSVDEHIFSAGALLTPQGKVAFDFLISRDKDGYVIDIQDELAADFIKRLSLYKLRAKVEIAELAPRPVNICWPHVPQADKIGYIDRRFPTSEHVARIYGSALGEVDRQHWDMLRIAYGVAESGRDFKTLDVFAHDINLDQIGGLCFSKGCYIGQEVVSRMHHRKTARRRLMVVDAQADLPLPFTIVESQGHQLGYLGSVVGQKGLALVRIDRVKNVTDNGSPITIAGTAVELTIPKNVQY